MKLTLAAVVVAAVIGASMTLLRRARREELPLVGGLYSTAGDEDGKFGIIKVLAVDKAGVHVSIYQNRFASRPISCR